MPRHQQTWKQRKRKRFCRQKTSPPCSPPPKWNQLGRGRSQGAHRLSALTWREAQRFAAEGRGRSHPPPPPLPPPTRQPPPPRRSLLPRSPAALEPPARLLTSRRRRRFHPGPSLCDVTMTKERGLSVREPGAAGGGGREGRPARGGGGIRGREGGALTSRRLITCCSRARTGASGQGRG